MLNNEIKKINQKKNESTSLTCQTSDLNHEIVITS
jgi:hypothetical protein